VIHKPIGLLKKATNNAGKEKRLQTNWSNGMVAYHDLVQYVKINGKKA